MTHDALRGGQDSSSGLATSGPGPVPVPNGDRAARGVPESGGRASCPLMDDILVLGDGSRRDGRWSF